MKDFTKADIAHASKFGIDGAKDSFYSLMDRLQKHSEWKYPERKWTNDVYYGIAFQWMGKEQQLEQRVLMLEVEMELKKQKDNEEM